MSHLGGRSGDGIERVFGAEHVLAGRGLVGLVAFAAGQRAARLLGQRPHAGGVLQRTLQILALLPSSAMPAALLHANQELRLG